MHGIYLPGLRRSREDRGMASRSATSRARGAVQRRCIEWLISADPIYSALLWVDHTGHRETVARALPSAQLSAILLTPRSAQSRFSRLTEVRVRRIAPITSGEVGASVEPAWRDPRSREREGWEKGVQSSDREQGRRRRPHSCIERGQRWARSRRAHGGL